MIANSYFSPFYLLVHLAYLPYMQMRGHQDRVAPPGVPPAHLRASSSWRMPTSEFRSIFPGPDPNSITHLEHESLIILCGRFSNICLLQNEK